LVLFQLQRGKVDDFRMADIRTLSRLTFPETRFRFLVSDCP
jgi:hypothetical protein